MEESTEMYRRKRGEMYRNAGEKVVKSTENKSKKWIKVRKYRGKKVKVKK